MENTPSMDKIPVGSLIDSCCWQEPWSEWATQHRSTFYIWPQLHPSLTCLILLNDRHSKGTTETARNVQKGLSKRVVVGNEVLSVSLRQGKLMENIPKKTAMPLTSIRRPSSPPCGATTCLFLCWALQKGKQALSIIPISFWTATTMPDLVGTC